MKVGNMKSFVIFGIGRSGSTLLVSLLNDHSAIHCDGEIFSHKHAFNWRRPLRSLRLRFPIPYLALRKFMLQRTESPSVYGFKLLVQQTLYPERLVPQLHQLGWDILYLERLSIFSITISALVARHTRRFHSRQGQIEPDIAPFVVAPEQFMDVLRERVQVSQRSLEIVAALPHLHLVYERDLASPDFWPATIARICTYIGTEPPTRPVATQLQKPWSRPYSELIVNYSELVQLARQNGYDVQGN